MLGRSIVGIGAVVLAAGAASRMGSAKQLLPFAGESLVRRAVLAAIRAGCEPVVVVTGAHAALTRRVLDGLPVVEAFNDEWESGMASSIRAGIGALIESDAATAAAIITLCDQPFVTSEVISALKTRHHAGGERVIASRYGETFGVPALFPSSFFDELTQLQGQAGAKQVIARHAAEADFIEFSAGAVDIDTPADYARLTVGAK